MPSQHRPRRSRSDGGLRYWRLGAALAMLLAPLASAHGEDVIVRVVFQFKDELLRRQYSGADLPNVEKDISGKLALACKAYLKHWDFQPVMPNSLEDLTPSAQSPALVVWVSHGAKYELLMALRGPAAAAGLQPWRVTLYERAELSIQGLPDGDRLAADICNKFRYSDDSETLLQRNGGDIHASMQRTVPIALGNRYKYLGPNPLTDQKDAVVVVMLDTTREEYKELKYSKFLIRYTFQAPKAGEAKAFATADGEDPPQPLRGLKLFLASWGEGAAEPAELEAIRAQNGNRLAEVLTELVAAKCELVYLWEFKRQDAIQ